MLIFRGHGKKETILKVLQARDVLLDWVEIIEVPENTWIRWEHFNTPRYEVKLVKNVPEEYANRLAQYIQEGTISDTVSELQKNLLKCVLSQNIEYKGLPRKTTPPESTCNSIPIFDKDEEDE